MLLLLCAAFSAWGATETISGSDSPDTKDNAVVKTAVTILSTYVPSGKSTINDKNTMKVRCKKSDASTGNESGFALKVNEGYKVTAASVQYSGNAGTITLSKIVIDGAEYSGSYSKDIAASNASGDKYTQIELTDIEATQYINFVTDNESAKDQGFIYIELTYEELAGVTHAPTINFVDGMVSITTTTADAIIKVTTDGDDPKETGTIYDGAFELDKSCTVRAYATKDGVDSEETTKDCYVTPTDAVTVLGFNSGAAITGSGGAATTGWMSTDEKYVLIAEANPITYVGLAGSQDGFKLNANETYTLHIHPNVKVERIVVVGKTWLASGTSTISFDGFAPAIGTFFPTDADRNTYVKSIEFTPNSELNAGATITFTPGGKQLGAYFEIYGTEIKEPEEAKTSVTVTEVATINSDGTCTSVVTPAGTSAVITTSGNTNSNTFQELSPGLKLESSTGQISIAIPTGASSIHVDLLTSGSPTSLNLNGTSTTVSITNNVIALDIADSFAGTTYTIKKGSGSPVIYKITLTYTIGTDGEITLTTTENMDGWRSFVDESEGYTVDDDTKIYIVTAEDDAKATLTEVTGRIPAGTPVLLKTSAADRTMTLTIANSGEAIDARGNKLERTTAVTNLSTGVLRLGYGSDGLGFYEYAATTVPAGIVYLPKPTDGAKWLDIAFVENETTALDNLTISPLDKEAQANVQRSMFNVCGQRVSKDYKGIVIVNGRKYLNK